MARTTTTQYQPTATTETATDDALSVAVARDNGKGLNNYKYHAGNHKFISELWSPRVYSLDTSDVKNLILYLGRWWIPEGQRQVRWWLTSKQADASTDWFLACSPDFYRGPEIFDSTILTDYKEDSVTCDEANWKRRNSTLSLCRPDFNGYRWFYLLATNADAIDDRSEIVALDAQPLVT